MTGWLRLGVVLLFIWVAMVLAYAVYERSVVGSFVPVGRTANPAAAPLGAEEPLFWYIAETMPNTSKIIDLVQKSGRTSDDNEKLTISSAIKSLNFYEYHIYPKPILLAVLIVPVFVVWLASIAIVKTWVWVAEGFRR